MKTFALITLTALTGCLSSIVDGECADGYLLDDGACIVRPEPEPEPEPEPDPMAHPERPTAGPGDMDTGCTADVESDPNACGACGVVCPSGICSAGACVGDVLGRVILIGHDYTDRNTSATRLLGNALDLPFGANVRVATWRGTATSPRFTAAGDALAAAAGAAGVTMDRVELDALPVESASQILVILPQSGAAAAAFDAGAAWAPAAIDFVEQGGVVIALGGAGTVTEHLLAGAGLLDATLAGDATGTDLAIVAPTAALVAGVAAPYRAETSTTSYAAGRGTVVVTDPSGNAIVIDAAGL